MDALTGLLDRLRGEPMDEAEYGRDVDYQKKTEQIIKNVARYLNTQNGPPPEVGFNPEGILTMVFRANVVPGLKSHKDLVFMFFQSPMAGADFADTRPEGGEIRMIRVHSGIPPYRLEDLKYIIQNYRIDIIGKSAAWFLRQKNSPAYHSLQHELFHYFDTTRIPVGKAPPSGTFIAKGDIPGYHRSPMEFNAFFQTGAAKVRREVEAVLRSKRGERWQKDRLAWLLRPKPDADIHRFGLWWEESYLSSMWSSPDFRKRFLSRWAVLWKGLKAEVKKAGLE